MIIYDPVYPIFKLAVACIFHRAAGGFHTVRQHQNSLLGCERYGAFISEIHIADLLFPGGHYRFCIEKSDKACTVMRADKINNNDRKTVLIGYFDSFSNMDLDDKHTYTGI